MIVEVSFGCNFVRQTAGRIPRTESKKQIFTIMSLTEILNSGVNVTLTVTVNDLKEAFNQFAKERERVEAETMLTVEKVCEITGKVRSTIWSWERKGYLIPTRVGKQLLYKKSDIDKLMMGGRI